MNKRQFSMQANRLRNGRNVSGSGLNECHDLSNVLERFNVANVSNADIHTFAGTIYGVAEFAASIASILSVQTM
jgi:hypothetical protein